MLARQPALIQPQCAVLLLGSRVRRTLDKLVALQWYIFINVLRRGRFFWLDRIFAKTAGEIWRGKLRSGQSLNSFCGTFEHLEHPLHKSTVKTAFGNVRSPEYTLLGVIVAGYIDDCDTLVSGPH